MIDCHHGIDVVCYRLYECANRLEDIGDHRKGLIVVVMTQHVR